MTYVEQPGYDALWLYFGLSYSGWLTMPRCMMHQMPDKWQAKMAELLNEWDDAWKNMPDVTATVSLKRNNRFVSMPDLSNYRRPNLKLINSFR